MSPMLGHERRRVGAAGSMHSCGASSNVFTGSSTVLGRALAGAVCEPGPRRAAAGAVDRVGRLVVVAAERAPPTQARPSADAEAAHDGADRDQRAPLVGAAALLLGLLLVLELAVRLLALALLGAHEGGRIPAPAAGPEGGRHGGGGGPTRRMPPVPSTSCPSCACSPPPGRRPARARRGARGDGRRGARRGRARYGAAFADVLATCRIWVNGDAADADDRRRRRPTRSPCCRRCRAE